jgi:hydrogenase expression/formation protein HypE
MSQKIIGIEEGPVCPLPLSHNEAIVLGHGSGGRLSHNLIRKYFYTYFKNPMLLAGNDAAIAPVENSSLIMSTDSHVVSPLFFPGGDIGRLAICGTVNDVAMMGAQPLYLSVAFILEEGLELITLSQILDSMRSAAEEADVKIVTGDTKVVEKNNADGIYINTTGVGFRNPNLNISGSNAQEGDVIILSGGIGEHGIAVLQARGELGFSSNIHSDVAPLNHLVTAMLDSVPENTIHVFRDPTRGGLATTLNEIAEQSQVGLVIEEECVLVKPEVNAVCEMLGFDPLYVANEGKLVGMVKEEHVDKLLLTMRKTRYGENATIIGRVTHEAKGRVLLKTSLGSTRVLDMLSGEMLPRIC